MMTLTTETENRVFTAADFRLRAAMRGLSLDMVAEAADAAAQCHSRGDHVLNPDLPAASLRPDQLLPAAVLVPVVNYGSTASVILTLRSAHLPSHAGQIAFPGGKMGPEDASVVETALRETAEEIGISREFIEPVGLLDTYRTGTGFHVVPVLAVVSPGFSLTPDPREVADVFEVPLSFLMTEANHRRDARELYGKLRHYHAIPFGDRYIWGATAGILRSMYERLYAE